MMTIFTMAFAAVMFSGMVLCMGMFLKHVVNSIPEMTTHIARPLPGVKSKLTDHCTTHKTHESKHKTAVAGGAFGRGGGHGGIFPAVWHIHPAPNL